MRLAAFSTVVIVAACATSGAKTGTSPAGGYDLVISHARIVDGTGNPWFFGDVGVKLAGWAGSIALSSIGRDEIDEWLEPNEGVILVG